jgi:metal-dependent amidase/aminoacylase/carboxypeptidase family protein
MTSPIDHVRRYHEELTAIRRDIHAHPELGLEEHRTADLVAQKLEEWGIEVHRSVGGTGVVGVLRSGAADHRGQRFFPPQSKPWEDACLRS